MCCSSNELNEKDADGKCPDCGHPTVDGEPVESCSYSPVECETCGWQPCDFSC